jgi:hypothetical protein
MSDASPHGAPAAATGIDRLRGNRHQLPNRLAGSYRLDGSASLYTDRHSRRVLTILCHSTHPNRKGLKFQILLAGFS